MWLAKRNQLSKRNQLGKTKPTGMNRRSRNSLARRQVAGGKRFSMVARSATMPALES
jgi:hypothetical protein